MKIYNKRGNLGHKEKRLVAQITEAVNKKLIENPSLQITPANTPAELEQLYNEYCTETVEFEEISKNTSSNEAPKTTDTEKQHKEFRDGVAENVSQNDKGADFIDPFNRDEAIVRDYVKQSDFPGDKNNSTGSKTYGEPQTSFDQMKMPPTDEEMANEQKDKSSSSAQSNSASKQTTNTSTPTNNNNGVETDAQKSKRSKKFAKTIVLLVSRLYEKGVIWWGTKDINEAKLQEHSAKGELDLLEQLSLTEEQDIAVKDFFNMQCMAIQKAVKVTQEEKDRLTDSLAELLVEKKIAPSNSQMLIFDIVEVFGLKTLAVYQLTEQTKSLLEQLIIKTKRENQMYGNENGGNSNTYDPNANHNTTETNRHTHTTTDVDETIKEPVTTNETNLAEITK